MSALPESFLKGHHLMDLDLLGKQIQQAKKSGLPVGSNILLGPELQPWLDCARVSESAGADFVELNFSCPRKPWGLYFSRDLALSADIVKRVRSATRLPLVVKLHAWLLPDELKELARTVVAAGADAISTTNIFHGLVGIDIETGTPWAHDLDDRGVMRGNFSSFSGPSIRPLGLRAVADIASAVDVPIIGLGGVADWRSAVEYMMAGASAVQVGMAAMLFGYGMVKDMVRGLDSFMKEKGYENPGELVGLARRKFPGFGETAVPMAVDTARRMRVDQNKCDGCGKCVNACFATADGAIKVRQRLARVNDKLCIRCNACRLVCPNQAIVSVWDES